MTLTQENRLLSISTRLGRDVLILLGFQAEEGLSVPFQAELQMLSQNHNIAFGDIIGTFATVSIQLANGEQRYIHGLISRFSQGRGGEEAGGDPRYSHYTAMLVPWLWLLSRTTDSRIFQNLSVPDIVEQIFREKGFSDFSLRLHGNYPPREYCVQYRETDFNFVSRLLEEEGIFYYFEHEEDKHTLVLGDASEEHQPCPHQDAARYRISAGSRLEEDMITALERAQEIMEGKCTLNDFNFTTPTTNLRVEVASRQRLGPGEREWYEYPGSYSRRADGDRLVNIRMQEREARITTIAGASTCRAFTSGYRFELRDHYLSDLNNKRYVLTRVAHQASQGASYPGGGGGGDFSYTNRFECIPHEVPYRPPLDTRKPLIQGCQTAIVVGPQGEEIHTDRYGRVKVQFHWDREGARDQNSSCWIRVSQPWAGAGWGGVSIPRIGHEVIVDFLEGDPDRPIITGRVYHGHNLPPYDLPGGGIVSGMKSSSSPGGGGYNEFSMNDTKGKEGVTVHAQYDMGTTVEHDQTLTVKNDQTVTIKQNRTTTVEQANDTLTVKAGKRSVTVKGDTTLTVQSGNRTVKVSSANYSAEAAQAITLHGKGAGVSVTGDSKGVTIKGSGGTGISLSGSPNIEASGKSKVVISSPDVDIGDKTIKIHGTKIELSAGKSQIVMDASGITISGLKISSTAKGPHTIKGGTMTTSATGPHTITGIVVKIN